MIAALVRDPDGRSTSDPQRKADTRRTSITFAVLFLYTGALQLAAAAGFFALLFVFGAFKS